MTTEWVVSCHAGAWAPQRIYGPYATVSEAARGAPMTYTATLLPVIDGKRSCVEDNAASNLFRSLRRPRTMDQMIDRATQ